MRFFFRRLYLQLNTKINFMGLFSERIKRRNNVAKEVEIPKEIKEVKTYNELLKLVDIDLESFKFENLDPEEVTLDDELHGVVRKARIIHERDRKYNFINLSEHNDGKKELSLSKFADEYDMKALVNKYDAVFGPDDNFNSEFTDEDTKAIRHTGVNTIRMWGDNVNDEYHIKLSYIAEDALSNISIF